MVGKRKSTNPTPGNDEGEEAKEETEHARADATHPPTTVHPPPKLDRRREMADIARRRAAHFATWDDPIAGEDDGSDQGTVDGDNPHTGGSAARTLGPWSTAVELANARERQRARREEGIMTASRAATEPAGSLQPWTPSRSPLLGRRPTSQVPLLSSACLRLVVDLLEDVVGGVYRL